MSWEGGEQSGCCVGITSGSGDGHGGAMDHPGATSGDKKGKLLPYGPGCCPAVLLRSRSSLRKIWSWLTAGRLPSADKLKVCGPVSHPHCLPVTKTQSDTAASRDPLIFRESDKFSSVSAEI